MLEAWVDVGALSEVSSDAVPGFNERLISCLPTMVEHRCSVGERGGFFQRLERGTYPAHILEHVALELQSLAGTNVGFGKARALRDEGMYRVVCRFEDEAVGRAALHEARALLLAAYDGRPCDAAPAVARLRNLAAPAALHPATPPFFAAAKQRGLPAFFLTGEGLIQLGQGARQRRLKLRGLSTDRTSAVAEEMATDRALYRPLLRAAGVPVPYWSEVHSAGEAGEAAESIGLPVCVTPLDQDDDPAFFQPLHSASEIAAAFETAQSLSPHVAVEQSIEGRSFHLLVFDGQILACVDDAGRPLGVDSITPDIAEIAQTATAVIGLDLCEIHLRSQSLQAPGDAQTTAVIAVRARPDLAHYLPEDPESAQRFCHQFLDALSARTAPGRIPIVAVVGGAERRAVALATAEIFKRSGLCVGFASGERISVDGRELPGHWHGLFERTRALLINPHVEAMVVEFGRRDVLTEGLAFDRCSVAVVTGLDEAADLPLADWGFDDACENLLRAERCPAEVVVEGGVALLNASDPRVASMAEQATGRVAFYEGDPTPAIRDALRQRLGGPP